MIDLIIILVMGIVALLPVIGYWRLFEKAQQRGWKILIPIYNLFIFLRIIKRPGWWILLYLIPPIWLFLLIIDSWRCHTLFGMNIDFYNNIKNRTFWNILKAVVLSPYKLGLIMTYGMLGFPNISFNRKAFYSTEYLEQLSKDKPAKELYDMHKEKRQDLLEEYQKDYQMAKPLGIPLFSYDLAKDHEKDEDLSWPQILGAISWLGLFIYFWIADWGKPGFTDADLSKIHNPLGRELLSVIQPEKNNTKYIKWSDEISPSLDFIMDLFLYTLCALIGTYIIMYVLNFTFRVFNNIYWDILSLIRSYRDKI